MADEKEEQPAAEAGDGTDTRSKKRLIIMIAAASVLLIAVGGGAFFFLAGSKSSSSSDHGAKEAEAAAPAAEEHKKDAKGKEDKSKAKAEKKSEHGQEKKEEGHDKKDAKGKEAAGHEADKSKTEKKEESEEHINFGQTFNVKPFNINLGNPLENRYLRLEIALEYRNGPSQQKELEARLPQLRDAIISVASKKTREFLLGPDGKDQLRLELLNRVNQYLDKKIESVYITDMLIE